MRVRNHGKYTKMRKNNPLAIARCDYSGLMVQHGALQRQMQYRGSGLVWTGYYVYSKFVDEPNPQNLTPLIYADPKPILNARPDNQIDAPQVQLLELDVSGGADVYLTLEQFANTYFVFTGTLLSDVTIFVPGTFNEFYVTNKTEDFTLKMQIIDNSQSVIELPRVGQPFIVNDCFTLKFIHTS